MPLGSLVTEGHRLAWDAIARTLDAPWLVFRPDLNRPHGRASGSAGMLPRGGIACKGGIVMHMRVVRIRQDPARWDESVPAMLAASEAVRQLPGCQSLVVAGDRATGEAFAVSTWDTEDHARFERDVVLAGPTRGIQAVGGQLDPPLVFEVFG
jgi:hypothetical protein